MSVLALGTVALDDVKTPFGRRRGLLGGSAAHFSMSCRLFTPVHLVAVVGEDFPQKYLSFLKNKGVIIDSLRRVKGKSFSWRGEYRGDLNSALTLKTELGVLVGFKPKVSISERKIQHLFLANLDPDIQRDLLGQMGSLGLVALDSMNYWIEHKLASLRQTLKKVDLFLANDQEARSLSQETNLIKAARSLRKLGPKMILIKKGEHGVLFLSDNFKLCLPAYPTERVIDPTGAGDTFAGALMGCLARSRKINAQSIKKALAYASVAASFNVEGFGLSKTASLTLGDLKKRLAHFRKCASF